MEDRGEGRDYLRSTAAWPSSGDVAVNLCPTGTYKSTTDRTRRSRCTTTTPPRPEREPWLIWRRDPAYGGRR